MERIAEAEVKAKAQKSLDEVKSEIVEFISANKSNMSVVKPVLEICRENGCGNPNEIDNIEVAEKVLAACKK